MKRKKGTGETVVSLSVPRSCVSCVVCSEIIHDPHRVLCPCARSFCKACVEPWLRENGRCPACNTDVTNRVLIPCCREWGDVLDSVPRPCPNSSKCRFRRGGHEEAALHAQKDCAFRLETCPNEACGQILQHKMMKEHLRLCRLKKCRNFRAPRYGCQEMGTQREIEQHEAKCHIPADILKQLEELIKP
jgi:hypothetical protein